MICSRYRRSTTAALFRGQYRHGIQAKPRLDYRHDPEHGETEFDGDIHTSFSGRILVHDPLLCHIGRLLLDDFLLEMDRIFHPSAGLAIGTTGRSAFFTREPFVPAHMASALESGLVPCIRTAAGTLEGRSLPALPYTPAFVASEFDGRRAPLLSDKEGFAAIRTQAYAPFGYCTR